MVQPGVLVVRRVIARGIIGGLLVYGVGRAVYWVADWPRVVALFTQADHAIYMAQAHRVLAGGPLYPAWELSGPFLPNQLPQVYPPLTVYGLIVPMSLLPDALWWIVPLAIVASVVIHHRPSEWGWALILALLIAYPDTWTVIAAGNPSLWVAAGLALATVRRPFAILALVKPTLSPLALLGARSRAWWTAMAAYGAASLALLPASVDYLHVLGNYREPLPLPPKEWALLAIPLVAWGLSVRRVVGGRHLVEHGVDSAGGQLADAEGSSTPNP